MPASPLYDGPAGSTRLPEMILCDRSAGGHLIVDPPRPVWERSALSAAELCRWSLLIAATGKAMLETLPMLHDGCLNYWEAGNWALNCQALPSGPKAVCDQRRVHQHIFGRSRQSIDPDWRWGESPRFPDWLDSECWAASKLPLNIAECAAIAQRIAALMQSQFRPPF